MARIRRLTQADGNRFLTIEEASRALGIKPTAIRNYLHGEKMTTYKFKSLTLLSYDEITAWKNRRKMK